MANSFYLQKSNEIFPIFGVNSISEAREFVSNEDKLKVIETDDKIFMNPATGSVDFQSSWEADGVDISDLVEVFYSIKDEEWVQA